MTTQRRDPYQAYREAMAVGATLDEQRGRVFAPELLARGAALPAPDRFGKLYCRAPRIALLGCKVIACLWPILFFPLLTLAKTARIALACVFARRHGDKLPESAVLCLSTRAPDVVSRIAAGERPNTWITVPWHCCVGFPPGETTVDLCSLVTPVQILCAVRDAFLGTHLVFRTSAALSARLRTYDALYWFLLWHVLRSHASVTQWWIVNHYDRWAYLVDRVLWPGQPGAEPGQAVLLQHGMNIEERDGWLPYKLENVGKLFAISAAEEEYFRKHLLADPAAVEFRRLPSKLQTVALEAPGARVLLAGFHLLFEKEEILVRTLLQRRPDVTVYVKPHPLYPSRVYARLAEVAQVVLIQEPKLFPVVDVVLSPHSTLGREYEAIGCPVVWHESLTVDESLNAVCCRLPLPAAGPDDGTGLSNRSAAAWG